MKTAWYGWLLGSIVLASHVGCCSVQMVGGGCDTVGCGDCGPIGGFGTLRTRIADRIRSTNCGSGCGEIYWDEHINEPPVCDPCGCDGEFDCGASGSCPSAFARLRSLWGYRYQPAGCGDCGDCGMGPSPVSHPSTCSTCAGNTSNRSTAVMHERSMSRVANPSSTSTLMRDPDVQTRSNTPTPAVRPMGEIKPSVAPEPMADPNASMRHRSNEGLTIGSGTSNAVSTRSPGKPAGPPRTKLATNPR